MSKPTITAKEETRVQLPELLTSANTLWQPGTAEAQVSTASGLTQHKPCDVPSTSTPTCTHCFLFYLY